MILHIFPDEKFTLDFIGRTEKLFGLDEHLFWIYNIKTDYPKKYQKYINNSHFYFRDIKSYKYELLNVFSKASRIIFHSLFFGGATISTLNNYLKGTDKILIWIIWGADLYNSYSDAHSLKVIRHPKLLLSEFFRIQLIKKFDYVGTLSDYEELKKRYKTKAKQINCIYSYGLIDKIEQKSDGFIHVMVGHSATPTCRHLATFKLLQGYRNSIKVYCPLSYPSYHNNVIYIKKVIKAGKKYFGDNFYPILDFMSYEEYGRFLNTIDVGLFNNNRQQGHGNIINLLQIGKKIYLSKDNSFINIYNKKNGFITFDINQLDDSILIPLTTEQRRINHDLITNVLSDENFFNTWNNIYHVTKISHLL